MQQLPSTQPGLTKQPIQVPLQRRKRHLSFWQRTVTVFVITVLLGLGVGTLLYTRTFSMDTAQATERDTLAPTRQPLQTHNSDIDNANQALPARPSLFQVAEPEQKPAEAANEVTTLAQANLAAVGTVQNEVTLAQSVANTTTVHFDEQPELQRAYRLAEQAIEFDDPRQAMESLLVLMQNHPDYRHAEVTTLLYRAYLAVGDLAMRDGERSNALDYYERANQLAVADKTALARRQQAIARFLSTTTAAVPTDAPTSVAEEERAPTAAVAPIATPSPTSAAIAQFVRVPVQCPDDHIAVSAPAVNEVIAGYATVMGSVTLEDLWFYKVEWTAAGSTEFSYFAGQGHAISNGALGTLDTRSLPNGDYLLRVTVVDDTGNYPPPCDIPVTIQN